MEILILTALFLGYSGWREWLHTNHVKEIEAKLMARTPEEYAKIKHIDNPGEAAKPEKDPEDGYTPLEETNVDDVLNGIKR